MSKRDKPVEIDDVKRVALELAESKAMRIRSEYFEAFFSDQIARWQKSKPGRPTTLRTVERWVLDYELLFNSALNADSYRSKSDVSRHRGRLFHEID